MGRIPTNPGPKAFGHPKPPQVASVTCSRDQLRAVALQQCPNWLKPIVIVAVNTGMRRSEILQLRPLDIDLHHGRILLRPHKERGKPHGGFKYAAVRTVLATVAPEIFSA